MTQPATSLFESVGGASGVSEIVEAFYRRVVADEVLIALYPDDLEPGKEKLKLFFAQWLGGPETYSQLYGHPRLRMRHFPFVIGDIHSGRWLRHMRGAWQEAGASAEVQAIVFERLGPLAHHMVNDTEDVPRTPLSDARLS